MRRQSGQRAAAMVLYALLSGQFLFGAAAVAAVMLKEDVRGSAAAAATTQVAGALDAGATVR